MNTEDAKVHRVDVKGKGNKRKLNGGDLETLFFRKNFSYTYIIYSRNGYVDVCKSFVSGNHWI